MMVFIALSFMGLRNGKTDAPLIPSEHTHHAQVSLYYSVTHGGSKMANREELEKLLENAAGPDRIHLLLDYGFSFHMEDPEKMLTLTEEAIQLSRLHDSREGLCRSYQQIAVYWGIQGNYDEALKNGINALSIAEEFGLLERQSGLYNNLAIIYCRMEDSENSINCAEKAIEMASETGNSQEMARGYNNLAMNMEDADKYPEAYENYAKALEILRDVNMPDQMAIALLNTAGMAVKTGRYGEAENYAETALKFSIETGSDYIECSARNTMGRIKAHLGSYEEAEKLLMEALDLGVELNNEDLQLRFLGDLMEFYEKTGNHRKALDFTKRHFALRQKIVEEKQNTERARLRAEFETKEREKEKEIYRLKNVELQLAKESAEASDRAKSFFLAMMSHEIRTPMNVITGMLEILLENNPKPDQISLMKKAYSSTRDLLGIINDILDFSKIEAGKFKIETVSMDIRRVMGEAIEMFTGTARRKPVSLEMNLDKSIPPLVKGDPLRLGQILRNLISNSLKFTEKGSVIVSAHVLKADPEKVDIGFSVEDTGVGIPEEKLHSLFKPFHQLDSSLTRKYGGTGLGLAICKHLIEEMNGKISVSSGPGEGTLFEFVIPFDIPSQKWSISQKAPSKSNHRLTGMKILIAEDQESIREIALHFLSSAGALCTTAATGVEALEKASREEFDIILMDIQMPEMDGIAATVKLRETGISIPIVATSGHAMPEHFEMYSEAGINGYLIKPYTREDLLNVVSRWVDEKAHS